MSASLRIKRAGSGSCKPKAGEFASEGGSPGAVWRQAFGDKGAAAPEAVAALGVPVFARGRGGDSSGDRYLVLPPKGEDWMDFDAYCEREGIEGAEREYLFGAVEDVPYGFYRACFAKVYGAVALHARVAPFALRLGAGGAALLHVGRMWEDWSWSVPFRVAVDWAKKEVKLIGYNFASRFLERPTRVGTSYANESAVLSEDVPGDFAWNHHPWPTVGGSGMVYVEAKHPDPGTGALVLGTAFTVPAWADVSAWFAYGFYGSEETWMALGFSGETQVPAEAVTNADVNNPASFFAKDDAALAGRWLPPVSEATGPYRPGVYLDADGAFLFAVAGWRHGMEGVGERVTQDGEPCVAAGETLGQIGAKDWLLREPTTGPTVRVPGHGTAHDDWSWAKAAENRLTRKLRLLWYFAEMAYPDDPGAFEIEVTVTTGSEPTPVERVADVTFSFYAGGAVYVSVFGQEGAPQVKGVTVRPDGYAVCGIDLREVGEDVLKREQNADGVECFSPGQRVTFRYWVPFDGGVAWKFGLAVGEPDEGAVTPGTAFARYVPYEPFVPS